MFTLQKNDIAGIEENTVMGTYKSLTGAIYAMDMDADAWAYFVTERGGIRIYQGQGNVTYWIF